MIQPDRKPKRAAEAREAPAEPSSISQVLRSALAEPAMGIKPPEVLRKSALKPIEERLTAALNGVSEEERAQAKHIINEILKTLPPAERLDGFGKLVDMVERWRSKGIAARAVCNRWLPSMSEKLVPDEKGKGMALSELHAYYLSPEWDRILDTMDGFRQIESRIALMSGKGQERAAILAQGVRDYNEFNRILECDTSGDGGEDRSIRRMKEDEVLRAIFTSRRVAEPLRDSLFGNALRTNIAFFSIGELVRLTSAAAAPYAAEAPPNEIRITIASSNSAALVLSLAEKMPAGWRLELPRLLVELAEKAPGESGKEVLPLVHDAFEVVRHKKPAETEAVEWLKLLREHFGQFQPDEGSAALASLRYIAKNPMSLFEE